MTPNPRMPALAVTVGLLAPVSQALPAWGPVP
jgi:hypothetical protein